jgi:hypothetical protein
MACSARLNGSADGYLLDHRSDHLRIRDIDRVAVQSFCPTAPARSAMERCASGGIILSSVPTRCQHGFERHAGPVTAYCRASRPKSPITFGSVLLGGSPYGFVSFPLGQNLPGSSQRRFVHLFAGSLLDEPESGHGKVAICACAFRHGSSVMRLATAATLSNFRLTHYPALDLPGKSTSVYAIVSRNHLLY